MVTKRLKLQCMPPPPLHTTTSYAIINCENKKHVCVTFQLGHATAIEVYKNGYNVYKGCMGCLKLTISSPPVCDALSSFRCQT